MPSDTQPTSQPPQDNQAPPPPTISITETRKARDMVGNWSHYSAPFTITTTATDPTDVTPPTTPTNVWADVYGDGGGEMQVLWTASTVLLGEFRGHF